jgi:hypothetical protein
MVSPAQKAYLARCYQQILADLTYPVDREGNVMDISAMKALVGWHLVRCGWRKPNNTDGFALQEEFDDPLIKSRRVYGPGVYEDAVQWVPFSDPDDPLDDLASMTMAEIEALPADLKGEAKRRLGLLPATEHPEPKPAWSVRPFVHIEDAPVDETTRWA